MSLNYSILGQNASSSVVSSTARILVSNSSGTYGPIISVNGTETYNGWSDGSLFGNMPVGATDWYDSSGVVGLAFGNNKAAFIVYNQDSSTPFASIVLNSSGSVQSSNIISGFSPRRRTYSNDNSLAFGKNKFVAIGNSSNGGYSTDGISWTSFTMPINANNIANVNSKFIATNDTTTGAQSTDGISWTSFTMPISAHNVVFGQNKFVALSATASAYSTDLVTWTQTTLPALSGNYNNGWRDIAFGNNTFVAINDKYASSPGTVANVVATSTDGVSWTGRSLTWSDGELPSMYGLDYYNGYFISEPNYYGANVAGGYANGFYSTDGISWTGAASGGPLTSAAISYGQKSYAIESQSVSPLTQYTVPANTESIISSIYVANNSASSQTYSVAVVPNNQTLSNVHYIRKDVSIGGNDFNTIETKITLSAGDMVITEGSSTDVSINIFGMEK